MATKLCPKCGTPTENTRLCSRCGADLRPKPVTPTYGDGAALALLVSCVMGIVCTIVCNIVWKTPGVYFVLKNGDTSPETGINISIHGQYFWWGMPAALLLYPLVHRYLPRKRRGYLICCQILLLPALGLASVCGRMPDEIRNHPDRYQFVPMGELPKPVKPQPQKGKP